MKKSQRSQSKTSLTFAQLFLSYSQQQSLCSLLKVQGLQQHLEGVPKQAPIHPSTILLPLHAKGLTLPLLCHCLFFSSLRILLPCLELSLQC